MYGRYIYFAIISLLFLNLVKLDFHCWLIVTWVAITLRTTTCVLFERTIPLPTLGYCIFDTLVIVVSQTNRTVLLAIKFMVDLGLTCMMPL
jgi:hypothetical protein